jgi:hypothetical protein
LRGLGFKLVDGLVRSAKPSAQLATEPRKELDGSGWGILRKRGKLLVAAGIVEAALAQ